MKNRFILMSLKFCLPLTLFIVFFLAGSPKTSQAAKLETSTVVVHGFNNVYAPFVNYHVTAKKRYMYSGGWLTAQDQANGSDRLFYCQLNSARNCLNNTLIPVNWTNRPNDPGTVPGFHANDPTVIHPYHHRHARKSWVYMYYTALPDSAAATTECADANMNNSVYDAPRPGCSGVPNAPFGTDSAQHKIGFASGSNGTDWHDHGPILSSAQGVWSPSALRKGNEIWLYYHDAVNVKLHRQKLKQNGHEKIGNSQQLQINGTSEALVNVDVQFINGKYILLANTIGDDKIIRLVSSDGINFYKSTNDATPVLISSTTHRLPGPHTEKVDLNHYRVYFGWAVFTGTGTNPSGSMHAWKYEDVLTFAQ